MIGQMKLGKCHMTIRQCTMGQFYGMYSTSDWLNEALTLIAWFFVASLDTCDWSDEAVYHMTQTELELEYA